jgi:hypothetical protein|tara:strand:- start:621 stop:1259 length:639 start_codon:yes stop_codon:yes gene_type:complete
MENYTYLEYFLLLILAIFSGLSLRLTLGYAKQVWATTYHHTLSYALLPVITMIITTLIAGNLALSLGMIGALSIVRFRNPVKSPLELVIYFALITIGIGSAVNFKLSIILTIIINVVILIFNAIQNISDKKGKTVFSLSFEEGSTVNTIEIKSTSEVKILDQNKNLSEFFSTNNPISYNYRLLFASKEDVSKLKEQIKDNKDIESIDIKYAR